MRNLKTPKEPKALGIRIGSKRERLLTMVKDVREAEIKDCLETIYLDKIVIKALEQEILKEKEKFK